MIVPIDAIEIVTTTVTTTAKINDFFMVIYTIQTEDWQKTSMVAGEKTLKNVSKVNVFLPTIQKC